MPATADESGVPWASPVWFASADYRAFLWVSAPGARHSRNLAGRPQVGDRDLRVEGPRRRRARRLHIRRRAEVAGGEIAEGIEIFSRESEEQGLSVWTSDQVRSPARHRLNRAVASEHFVLSLRDERLAVSL